MPSLDWYMNRLSMMSPDEVWHRARVTTRQWMNWPRHHLQRLSSVKSFFTVEDASLRQAVTERSGVRFYALRTAGPIPPCISRDATVQTANDLLEHRFSFFDLHRHSFGEVIQWNYNYKDHKVCPLFYAPRIDYRDERLLGDVKYVWELNRHQHFVPLAKAYYLTGDERYAREVVTQVLSWIEQCPYMEGINWTTAEQAALRILSWVWAFEWIRTASCVSETFIEHFLRSLYQHVEFISQSYSRFSSANNHLICEATGVFTATLYFPELKEADHWRVTSYKILLEEALKQNAADGVNNEQATAYHCLVLEYLLLAGLLGEQNGVSFPKSYWQRVEGMVEVVAAFMDSQGRLPHLGDDDNGAVITLGPPPVSRARSILATGAALFGREDFRTLAPAGDERTFWLLGPTAVRATTTKVAAPVKRTSRAFHSGYYVMRSGSTPDDEVLAIFDCAPLGYPPLAAHGHADALSFTLTVAGREILIDPGTYAYHSQRKWRDYFRGTSAHNTIRIDEQDQSVAGGAFMWSEQARSVLEAWESSDLYDLVRGHHTGYLRLSDPVRHRREITYHKRARVFRLVDTIEAEEEHMIEQYFHFSEACQVRFSENEWLIHNQGVEMRLRADDQVQLTLIKGQEEPPLGWRSTQLGRKQPSPTLVGRLTLAGRCRLETTLSVIRGGREI